LKLLNDAAMLGSDPLMARHRKRPVSRHQAPGPDGSPAPPEAPDGRLGSALRRVAVTPTFAAGLGIVVAAVLAYPVQTVFSYVAPGALGQGGLQCGRGGCSQQSSPTGKPEPFGVGGGTLNPSPPATANPAGNDGTPAPSGQQTGTDGTEVARPHLSYKITSKWQGGFWGQIIITFPGAVPASWHLRFGYPGGHILGMNPDSHLATNGHAAVVRSSDYAAGSGPGGRTFAVGVGVQGTPTHPARCSFNGKTCHIG
jgi:hypothetical protein